MPKDRMTCRCEKALIEVIYIDRVADLEDDRGQLSQTGKKAGESGI